jgi:hypothetical protein
MEPLTKPARGSALLARRERRAARVQSEQRAMRAAKTRDKHRCRVPRCEFARKDMPIDACHLTHRGMGGNPSGDRTTRDQVVSLCRIHHGLLDRGVMGIHAETSLLADGALSFFFTDDGSFRRER